MNERPEISLKENRWGRTPEEVAAGPAPEVVVPPTLFCPFTMNVCPGVARCAPAHFMAQHVNSENNVSEDDGDEVHHANLICPIAAHVLYLRMIHFALLDVTALGEKDEDHVDDDTSQNEMSMRDRIIADLKLDE